MRRLRILVLAALIFASGCSLFGGKEEDAEPPTELTDIETTLKVKRAWDAKVGSGSERLRLGLIVATDGTNVYAASRKGKVMAFQAEDGKRIWSSDTDLPLSAGPGIGEGMLIVGSSDGDLVLLDAADGSERWRIKLSSELLATPVIVRDRIIVRSVDGLLRALSVADGSEIWAVEREVPRLTLRGNASPVVVGEYVLAGFDNGKVAAMNLQDGQTVWEISLTPPSGRTELERMVDVDADVWVVGGDVYISGFHGRTVSLALESGQILWSRDIDSYAGVGVDWNNVYVTDSDSVVVGMTRRSGTPAWRQEDLKFRTLTSPVPYGRSVVVGDFEGYLHWLDAETGAFVARTRSGESIVSPPVVVGETLLVLSEDGRLSAYRADFGTG
jgi:outer membrane protein assembly factor BamB